MSPPDFAQRLAALREEMRREGLDAFLVPAGDRFGGEFVAPSDQRLEWLAGFSGSAGEIAATMDSAAICVDSRYSVQARQQVDAAAIQVLDAPAGSVEGWLAASLPGGSAVGFDPWLYTRSQVGKKRNALEAAGLSLRTAENLVDRIWTDRPEAPFQPAVSYPVSFAGESRESKLDRMARRIGSAGADAALLARPESVAWLLNIRGSDVPRMPVVQAYAILHASGRAELFADPRKFGTELLAELGSDVSVRPISELEQALKSLGGPALADPETVPEWIFRRLEENGNGIVPGRDPCIAAKAIRNCVEAHGARSAQLRDGAAVARFLAWLHAEAASGRTTELDAISKLEEFRRSTGKLMDLSFDTIAASGPNGAVVHYRADASSNRVPKQGDLFLVDSGGQYLDGTTDITRTVAVGEPSAEHRKCYTRVMMGLIDLSRANWPRGCAGRDLDSIARYHLWLDGRDYGHGTGHGVGHYLGVHEGPQRISRQAAETLLPGMMVSIEPGYYREGEFGIRLENLVLVEEAPPRGNSGSEMLRFETLTYAPFDASLVDAAELSGSQKRWLNHYHADVLAKIGPLLDGPRAAWLERACRPI